MYIVVRCYVSLCWGWGSVCWWRTHVQLERRVLGWVLHIIEGLSFSDTSQGLAWHTSGTKPPRTQGAHETRYAQPNPVSTAQPVVLANSLESCPMCCTYLGFGQCRASSAALWASWMSSSSWSPTKLSSNRTILGLSANVMLSWGGGACAYLVTNFLSVE